MRVSLSVLVLALPLAACAAGPARLVEQGFPRGSLAVAAIDRGDYETAERLLEESPLGPNNPARLINLGRVYMATGRRAEAIAAWQAAFDGSRYQDLALADDEVVNARLLARTLLQRHGAQLAAR